MKLGVNIDHVATLRQARGTDYPDPLEAAQICKKAGAHGITVHLREDRRHIQDRDVERLRRYSGLPLNLEMACNREILAIALEIKPDEVCLVPERREELTTEGGLDVAGQRDAVRHTVDTLKEAGITASLFIEPSDEQIQAASDMGVPCIELHTGAFCNASGKEAQEELKRLIRGAETAHRYGITVNAGHGIHINTVQSILEIPHLDTLNIGHSIIARALFVGLEGAVIEMLQAIGKS